ncbi:MAG: hypothetical protein CMJ48_14390 [Planctomycetaceae bacterium]|nr:hypothetical protein [Planctomycetaceae bacterium]
MDTTISRIPQRLGLLLLGGLCVWGAVLTFGGLSPLTSDVRFNVAPFARCTFVGGLRDLNPNARLNHADLRALTCGTSDTLYMAELPLRDGVCEVQVELPWSIDGELVLIGDGGQSPATMAISAVEHEGRRHSLPSQEWAADRGVPAVAAADVSPDFRRLQLAFSDADSVKLNMLAIFTVLPRWKAWCLFLGLTVMLPLVCGIVAVLALLGWGRLPARRFPDWNLAQQMLTGFPIVLLLSLGWHLCPRHTLCDFAFVAALVIPAAAMTVRTARQRLAADGTREDGRLICLILAATALLVVGVMVDTNLVASRRMQPIDYLIPHTGAQRLAAGVPLDEQYASRPWAVHLLFAPWDHVLGRFSYWGYIGVLAGMNSLVLIPIAAFARRWG